MTPRSSSESSASRGDVPTSRGGGADSVPRSEGLGARGDGGGVGARGEGLGARFSSPDVAQSRNSSFEPKQFSPIKSYARQSELVVN